MPVYEVPVPAALQSYYQPHNTDPEAVKRAEETPGWATLDDGTRQKIIDNLAQKRTATKVNEQWVKESTERLRLLESMRESEFEARKLAVVELLSGNVTKDQVAAVQALVTPTSFRTLLKWIDGHDDVADSTRTFIQGFADEGTARTQANKALKSTQET